MSKKYTDIELINMLKQFYQDNGRSPSEHDFSNNPKFPTFNTYLNHFGTWNNALKIAGLSANQIKFKLTGEECCDICGSPRTSCWNYKNDSMLCDKCYAGDRNYLHGTLNPKSTSGIGVITEHVVYIVLGDCNKCNTIDEFHSDYDLVSNSYGSINVKASKLNKNLNFNLFKWSFGIRKNSVIPNIYICIGFNEARNKILKVWIIPNTANIIANCGIIISNSEKGLKRAQQYEVDSTPYNKVYQNLDITTLPEFRNLNKNINN